MCFRSFFLLQLNKKEATVNDISAFSAAFFVMERVCNMDMFSRLVSAGLSVESALDTIHWYRQQGDDVGLERHVREVEEKNGVCGV